MAKPKILYIDDEQLNLELFKMMFRSSLEAVLVRNASDAKTVIEEDSEIKLVLSDLNMPDTNGYDLLYELKQLRPDLKAYILTGHHPDDAINQHPKREYTDGFFQKPINKADLLALIESL